METSTPITGLLIAGIAHHQARRFGDAIAEYSRVIETVPQCGEAWRLLGVVALQIGDMQAARGLLDRAIRIDARDAAAHSALGSVSEAEGKLDLALLDYTVAYKIDPLQATAVVGLTRVTLRLGRAAEAVAIAEAAVSGGLSNAGLLRALGTARLALHRYAAAADALKTALRISGHADAYANLGAAYVHLNRLDDAILACEEALALEPRHAVAANNRGIAQKAKREYPAALRSFELAVELGSQDAHTNLGATRLLLGDYRQGWPHYGWSNSVRRASSVCAALPLWNGTASPEGRLLVWPEQGVGDTIQMIRFLPKVRMLVGAVTFACPPGTRNLLASADGADTFVDTSAQPSFNAFDCWLPTIRLPVVLDIADDSIPGTPYLRADPERRRSFRERLAAPGRLRVGLVWSGNPEFEWNELRSCGLGALEPLNDVSGVSWFALQQGPAKVEHAANGMQIVPINNHVADFADTAAIIAELDLILTVDTSVAHIAGALGRPAWVLLSSRPDWRWQLTGEVSPWYPTLRLFRQSDDGEWAPVVAAVAIALRLLVAARTTAPT